MRIGFNIHSTDDYISGVECYSLWLLRGLLDIDRQNQYLVFTNRPNLIASHIGTRDNLTIRDYSFLKNRLHRILWEHLKLPFLVQKEKLDILHCPHYICPAFRSSAAYVATIHDTIAVDHPNWCKWSNAAYYRLFLGMSAKTASRIIAVSKFTSQRISRNFNVNGSKVKVIYPGIDTGIFNPGQDAKRQNQVGVRYNLPPKYILFCGNIEPKKNIMNLLRAFKLLKAKKPEYALVITGNRTWKSKKALDYIHTDFENRDIILTGYIDSRDLSFVYKSADCLVLPSFCEGFGFPALEPLHAVCL